MSNATSIQTEQFLSFHLTSTIQAMLPTQQLTEILNLPFHQIVPIPDMPPQIMGVCNWRGEVLWLVDLGYVLGSEPLFENRLQPRVGSRRKACRAIVVQYQGQTLGLVVNQVNQMIWCDLAQVRALPETQLTPELAACLQGYWLTPQHETLLVLDSDLLIDFFHSQYL
jgi:positive phototaxis protein PixI